MPVIALSSRDELRIISSSVHWFQHAFSHKKFKILGSRSPPTTRRNVSTRAEGTTGTVFMFKPRRDSNDLLSIAPIKDIANARFFLKNSGLVISVNKHAANIFVYFSKFSKLFSIKLFSILLGASWGLGWVVNSWVS